MTWTRELDALTPFMGRLDPIYETVRKVKAALDPSKTLIGFAGAPWTVATYMVAGQGSRDQSETRHLAYAHPKRFQSIISRIEDAMSKPESSTPASCSAK